MFSNSTPLSSSCNVDLNATKNLFLCSIICLQVLHGWNECMCLYITLFFRSGLEFNILEELQVLSCIASIFRLSSSPWFATVWLIFKASVLEELSTLSLMASYLTLLLAEVVDLQHFCLSIWTTFSLNSPLSSVEQCTNVKVHKTDVEYLHVERRYTSDDWGWFLWPSKGHCQSKGHFDHDEVLLHTLPILSNDTVPL